MSDSDGESHAGDGEKKKDFIYKVKAFKRRTLHAVQKGIGKVDETKDEEYSALHEKFLDIDLRSQKVSKSLHAYKVALAALAEAGVALSDDMLEMYDVDSPLRPVAVMLKDVHESLNGKVRPPLESNWDDEVLAPTGKVLDRFKAIHADHERRNRYLADYDHYRTKYRALEENPKKEKLAEQIRETQQKLSAASEKYHTMNERLSTRMRVADQHKGTLFTDQLNAIIRAEQAFFTQGSGEFEKLLQTSLDKRYKQAAREGAEDLARFDASVKTLHSVGPSRVPSFGSSAMAQKLGKKNSTADKNSVGSSPAVSPKLAPVVTLDQLDNFDNHAAATSGANFEDAIPTVPAPAKAAASGGPKKWAKALYDYDATADTELTIKEGDKVNILREDDSGWWQGELRGKVGWFPYNYVEML